MEKKALHFIITKSKMNRLSHCYRKKIKYTFLLWKNNINDKNIKAINIFKDHP